jgi:predicted ATPase/DNA-binding SARP family transcriptional activator
MTQLVIDVIGPLRVSLAGAQVGFESAKVRALLAYLAVEAVQPHSRAALLGLFWPDYPEDSARHSLRQALFNLRSQLGDLTASTPYLLITRDTVQFNPRSDYTLDLAEFNKNYLLCKDSLGKAVPEVGIDAVDHCPEGLEEMVKLYRGEFLQDFFLADCDKFEDWALLQRENLHQRMLDALSYLADFYELHNDLQAARQFAARQLELDPWREEAYRQLMRLLALEGQRSAALAQYEICKRVLADELDVEPSAETRELYEQIRSGTLARPDTLQPQPAAPAQPPPAPLHNLPLQLTPFVGREAELARLSELIANPDCRCITLVGQGGIGKTRLALQAAGEHAADFAHGVAFVPLASVGSVEGVIPAITGAIQFSLYGPSAPKVQLLNYLHEKQLLLILDNLEHLLVSEVHQAYMAELLVELLQHAPGVKLLLTSREALELQGEWIFEVQGLAFPEAEQTQAFDEFDAVALFVGRARRVSPGFALNEHNRDQVAHICRLVGGMPLAIELAATWMRLLTPAEIVSEIENSLDFLSTSGRDLPERHRSMRAVFDHSWNMLSPAEQAVLCKLSPFRGGFTRQAAERVAGASLSNLSTLVNRTLLRRTSAGRYDLHDLVRQYSTAKLAADPQVQVAAQAAHYDYYYNLALSAEPGLKDGEQLLWLGRLEQDHDNLRAALEWALKVAESGSQSDAEGGGSAVRAMQLAGALRLFWRMRGYFQEGRHWTMKALAYAAASPDSQAADSLAANASALLGLGLLTNSLGEVGMASPILEESASIFQQLGDQRGLAEAYLVLGLTLRWQGAVTQSHARLQEALSIYNHIGDSWGEAQALFRLGSSLSDYSGDMSGRLMLERSAAILEALGEKYLYTMVLTALGIIDKGLGNYASALGLFERSLEISRHLHHPWGEADALTNLGGIYHIQGDYAAAQAYFEDGLRVYREHGHSMWEADVLCALAENYLAQADCAAARLQLQAISDLLDASANAWLQVIAGYFRGMLAYYEGDHEQAALCLAETVMLAREGGFKPDLARALVALGRVRLALGDTQRADELVRQGLGLFQELGQQLGIASALEALASISAARQEAEPSTWLLAAAHGLRQGIGAPLPPADRPTYEAAIEASRQRLGEPAFSALWSRASAASPQELIAQVLEGDKSVLPE